MVEDEEAVVPAEVGVDEIPHTGSYGLSYAIQIVFLPIPLDHLIGKPQVFAHYEGCRNHCCTFQ